MASLCCNEWLYSSHLVWLMDRVNEHHQSGAIGLCSSASNPEELRRIAAKRDTVNRLVLIVNVGRVNTASGPETFVSSFGQRSGNHWAVVTLDLSDNQNMLLYCDTLGWDVPRNLKQHLVPFTSVLGTTNLDHVEITQMHPSCPGSNEHHVHRCTDMCRNYPCQQCSDICGVISGVCAVLAAIDRVSFQQLTGPIASDGLFLKDPTRYASYLRRVLISWFMKKKLDLSLLMQQFPESSAPQTTNDGTGINAFNMSTESRKRKADPSSEEPNQKYPPIFSTPKSNAYPVASSKEYPCRKTGSDKNTNQNTPLSNATGSKTWPCIFCEKSFRSRQGVLYHKKNSHPTEQALHGKKAPQNCICQDCTEFSCSTIHGLLQHYRTAHQKQMKVQVQEFRNEDLFKKWRQDIEKETKCQFKQVCGQKQQETYNICYFYCNRSGKPTSPEIRKRALKSQGSCRIGFRCTCYIKTREDKMSGIVHAEYCLEHAGHCLRLAHTRLSEDLKLTIVGKLKLGLDEKTILNEIRSTITTVDRDTMVTKKDIRNIKECYGLSNARKDKDDATSCHMWVEAWKEWPENPIILFKQKGDSHHTLGINDFLLCIQTEFQKNMMLQHGSKIIFVDSTHGTTQYKYLLTTVLVLDDFQEAIPVAWAISNSEESKIITPFFNALKAACGHSFVPDIFMSDLANNFYNSWCSAFDHAPKKRLYCSWHVDRAWRKQLRECFGRNSERLLYNYNILKILQNETDEFEFRALLQFALSDWESTCPKFYGYFFDNYCKENKPYLWAGCYRIGAPANTNMYAESFHRILKRNYMESKQNKRVDELLVVLLKIAKEIRSFPS